MHRCQSFCKLKLSLPILFLTIVIAGCAQLNEGLSVPDVEQSQLKAGDGPYAALQGQVLFADTEFPLASTVTFYDDHVTTSAANNDFIVSIRKGTNDYFIDTPMGRHRGTVAHDGTRTHTLRFPTFPGSSERYFNELLTTLSRNARYTLRWPRETKIPIWIQSQNENREVTAAATTIATAAFREWEDVLGGALTFERVQSEYAATEGLILRFAARERIEAQGGPGAIAVCTYTLDPHSKRLVHGEITISHVEQESPALHRHEIGHCLGLGHSSDPSDVMYGEMTHPHKRLSDNEKQMARLLYSIPRGTPPFRATRTTALQDTTILHEGNDGLVTVVIPTYAPAAAETPR